ncbi:MAG: radical SAM protein [Candidatus Baldrarchaeia archaeon]
MEMDKYPRYVTPGFKPFDPVKLAEWTEKIVTRRTEAGQERKYTAFYATGVYRGIATGYTVGCCLRCIFCWVDWSRDFPERFGTFYSPEAVFQKLVETARKYGVKKVRISGAEPTIGKDHLLAVLERIEECDEINLFILETNGILFGVDKKYVEKVAQFSKVHVRVSLKAGTPEAFTRKTGAIPEAFEIPFKAIENLLDVGASFHVAAMSADPRIMTPEERLSLIQRLAEIDPRLVLELEEEVVDPYDTTLQRLKFAGVELEWPLRKIYVPVREMLMEMLKKKRGKK